MRFVRGEVKTEHFHASLTSITSAVLCLVAGLFLSCSCSEISSESNVPQESAQPPRVSGPMTREISFVIVEQKRINDALIFSIAMTNLDNAERVSSELVRQNSNEYMVRVFFYTPDLTPGKSSPLIRYEWTTTQGLVKDYDNRLPPPLESRDSTLPAYEVLFRIKQIHNGLVWGEVLVPTASRSMGTAKLEMLARAICTQEAIGDITMYSTRDAYEANSDAVFLKQHPNALKIGFLGSIQDGEFTAGSVLYP